MKGRIRSINIDPCLNGYVCRIGCQIAVFNKAEDMVEAFARYLNDPETTEEEWQAKSLVFNTAPEPIAERPSYENETVVGTPAQEAPRLRR